MRDSWQPNQPLLSEDILAARTATSALQKEVADSLRTLRERASPAARDSISTFSTALGRLGAAWGKFHSEYDAFRGDPPSSSAEKIRRLNQLLDQFKEIALPGS